MGATKTAPAVPQSRVGPCQGVRFGGPCDCSNLTGPRSIAGYPTCVTCGHTQQVHQLVGISPIAA